MNAKVEDFIKKMKEEQKAKKLKQREEHLISLGLLDENKTIKDRVYLDNWDATKDCKLDSDKNKYYIESYVPAPLEVTDEEYQEILKYAPITKEEEEETNDDKSSGGTTWANAIKVIANILLAINIIGGFILSIILSSDYTTDDFAWIPIIAALNYCILWYPIIVGFSKIVKVAEKTLQE